MIVKFAVYDAQTGVNTLYDTKEEAIQHFWANVINFAKSNFHNTAYVVVEQNEDGSERWFTDDNQEIDKPANNKNVEEMLRFAEELAKQKTPVEVLP